MYVQIFHEQALDELLDSGRGAKHRVSYHKLISNKCEWNNCFIKYQTLDKNISNYVFYQLEFSASLWKKFSVIKMLDSIFGQTTVYKINDKRTAANCHHCSCDAELRDAAHDVEPKAHTGTSGSRYTFHIRPWSTAYSELEWAVLRWQSTTPALAYSYR